MCRPPPDVVRVRIDAASNGEISTVAELVAKATPDGSGLNDAEVDLLAWNYHESMDARWQQVEKLNDKIPGSFEAKMLWIICEELGFVAEQKLVGTATVKQVLKEIDIKLAPAKAAFAAQEAAKEAAANRPEALEINEKSELLKKRYKTLRRSYTLTRII